MVKSLNTQLNRNNAWKLWRTFALFVCSLRVFLPANVSYLLFFFVFLVNQHPVNHIKSKDNLPFIKLRTLVGGWKIRLELRLKGIKRGGWFFFFLYRCVQHPVICTSNRVIWHTLQRLCGGFSMDWLLSLHHGFSGCCLRYQRLATAHYSHWNSWDIFGSRIFVSTAVPY